MESNNAVEWELVDYGSAVFHVASYQDGAGDASAVVETAPVIPSAKPEATLRECVFYRCWVAMRDGYRAS